jgi:hypothetical protein
MDVSIKQGSVLLLAHKINTTNNKAWQAVAILNATLEDIKIGFLYGEIKQNKLHIPTDENQVFINEKPVSSTYSINETQQKFRFLALIFIFIFVFFLFWRGR